MTDTGPLSRSKRGLAIEVAADLGDLLYDLTHDDKYRPEVGKLIQKARPDSPHAKAFKDVELEDRLSAFEKQQEERELENQRKQIVSRMEAQRQRLLEGDEDGGGRKYSEDDIKKIEELMQQKGLTDYEDGATLYSATMPQPGPLDEDPIRGSTWEFPEFAKFKDDPVKASKEVAYDVIREIQQKQRGRRR